MQRRLVEVLALTLLAGCAIEPPTTPDPFLSNAVPKSFFVGEDLQDPSDDPEFYSRTQVLEVGTGTSTPGLLEKGRAGAELVRVHFVIEENLLLARDTTDDRVVAAFGIIDHLDPKSFTCPATGDERQDLGPGECPWYLHRHMRVDFSRNLSVDSYAYDALSLVGLYGGVVYEPLAYYVNSPTAEDAPHLDLPGGYLDVTNKVFAKPQRIDLAALGWKGSFPACLLDVGGGLSDFTCNPTELILRLAFRRVAKTDFAPQDWTGPQAAAFGGLVKVRSKDSYGRPSPTRWLLAHPDLWRLSHSWEDPEARTGPVACNPPNSTDDPHRDLDGNGTEDECEAVTLRTGLGGSRCDTVNDICTLPFRAREPAPMTWFVTSGSDPEAYEGTEWAVHEWDVALRLAVATARLAECKATATSEAAAKACEATYPVPPGQQDDAAEAVRLAREVDDCRQGKAYPEERAKDPACTGLADRLGAARRLHPGVIALAKQAELVSLCHSPVEAQDPVSCGTAQERLPPGHTAAKCHAARLYGDGSVYAICDAAKSVRAGDLRHHTIANVAGLTGVSGLALDAADPETGENVASSITVWPDESRRWAQDVVDLSRVLGGELGIEDLSEAASVHDFAAVLEAMGAGSTPGLAAEEVEGALLGMVGRTAAEPTPAPSPVLRTQLDRVLHRNRRHALDAKVSPSSQVASRARGRAAIGTAVEATLVTGALQHQWFVAMPLLEQEPLLDLASPFRGGAPALFRDLRRLTETALNERGACLQVAPSLPLDLRPLAEALEAKFGRFNPADSKTVQFARAERMKSYLASRAQQSVVAHQLGHAFGLSHNLAASADPLSYWPQYWQLRTRDGQVTQACVARCTTDADCPVKSDLCVQGQCRQGVWDAAAERLVASATPRQTLVSQREAADCVGPRYFDPVTETERRGSLSRWMQGSIMDFAGDGSQLLNGLGPYDFAAARALYGGAVAVFADPELGWDPADAVRSAKARALLARMDDFGGNLGLRSADYSSGVAEPLHYSGMQHQLGLISGCSEVADVAAFKPAAWDAERLGAWHPALDGQFVAPDPAAPARYTRCSQRRVDYVPWSKLKIPAGKKDGDLYTTVFGDAYLGGPGVDDQGRVRTPLAFAGDRWADVGNPSVARYDAGADAYERFDFLVTTQEAHHVLANYRRHRQGFNVRAAVALALERQERLRDATKGVALMHAAFRDFATELGVPFEDIWPYVSRRYVEDGVVAAGLTFDHFARQLARPSSGPHIAGLDRAGNPLARAMPDLAPQPFLVGAVPDGGFALGGKVSLGGRLVADLSPSPYGEYNADFLAGVGSFYEKAFAPLLLTEAVDNFVADSRRDFVDPRYRAVSLADLFPEAYRRWLAAHLAGDDRVTGPRFPARLVGTGGEVRPVVERPEAAAGVDQPCGAAGDPACPSGSLCCANARLAPPFDHGVCIRGAACPQPCGATGSSPDAACPEGQTCCQGLCSTGGCFLDTAHGMGWTSWIGADGARACTQLGDRQACGAALPSATYAIDPQTGWETQKFLIGMTFQHLPEGQLRQWVDMLTLWDLAKESEPGFPNRLELHDPAGEVFLAKTFGKEALFDKRVQKSPGARVLEVANELLAAAYQTTPGPDVDGDGAPDWHLPVLVQGVPVVRCDQGEATCGCASSAPCRLYQDYLRVPRFLRLAQATFAEGDGRLKGVY